MPPKAEKLSQTIESLQLFLSRKAEEREDLAEISRQLAQYNKTLKQKKLTVQIVSQEPALAQAVFDLISAEKELKRFFQLKFDAIPATPQQTAPKQRASIKLRQQLNNGTGLQQYKELDASREYAIGRSPESDITINGKLYQGVSWNHAVILPSAEGVQTTQWQIGDRGSTNGTFVNGQQVEDGQLLSAGDVITLACPQTGDKVAELAFDVRVEALNREADREYWDAVDCDLIMVVIDSKEALAPEVKEFVQNLDRTYISQQFLLVDTPDPKKEPDIAKESATNLKAIESWVKTNLKEQGVELVPLYLKPFLAEDSKEEHDPRQLKKQERFIKTLGNVVKRQPENILAKRMAVKVVRSAEPVEPFLSQQQQELADKLAAEERELASLGETNLKEISKKAIAEANQNKDKFFKQIKLDMSQSKAALLDVYSKKSIVYQIQDFVDGLTPVVSSKNGQKIIQLNDDASDSKDINTSLIKFCTQSLEKWAVAEWQRINYSYGNGGLHSLLERLKQKTNVIPGVLSESPFAEPDDVDVKDNLLMSFAGTNCETTHKQKSLGGYIMKQLRSQMMQVMMMATLGLSMIGITANKGKLMSDMSNYFKQYPWLFGIFVCGIIFLLVSAYNNENDTKLQEAGVKLKKDLSGYYQSFTKNLLDKVIQDITLNLELEDKKIADSLGLVSEAYGDHLIEIEKKQIQIKSNLEKYRTQQKSLNTELSEFEKLKQM
ncbi:MAG: FHA domain-containing protein [Cyanobacteria bacterium J06635_13]